MESKFWNLLIFLCIQMNEAVMAALDEKLASIETTCESFTIRTSHFEVALSKVSPSVSDKVRFILRTLFCNEIWYLVWDKLVLEIYIGFFFREQQRQYYERLSRSLKAAWEARQHGNGFFCFFTEGDYYLEEKVKKTIFVRV
jgi:hypothetical protein